MPARFAQVSPNLYRGGEPSEDDLEMLRDVYGVKRIVSLDGRIGNLIHRVCERLGLKHIIFPLTNGADDDINSLKNNLIPVLNAIPTYLHCKWGQDRTGMTVALYRVLHDKWPVEKALGEAYRYGMGTGLDPITALNYYNVVRQAVNDNNNLDDAYEMRPSGNGAIGGLFEGQLSWAPFADPDSGVGLLGSDVNNVISGDRNIPDGIPFTQDGDGMPGAYNAGGHHYTLEPEAGSFHPNDVVLEPQF